MYERPPSLGAHRRISAHWTRTRKQPQPDKHPCLFQFVSYDSAPMVTIASGQVLRILHLEDSLTDHELTTRTLQRSSLQCSLHQVDSLIEFQRLTDVQAFDLILADYRLPVFTALNAWAHVSQKPQHPPFVLLSGAIGEAAAVSAMHLGFADYLLKDDLQRLPHVIARALEVHEARNAREHAVAELAASERRLAELLDEGRRLIVPLAVEVVRGADQHVERVVRGGAAQR